MFCFVPSESEELRFAVDIGAGLTVYTLIIVLRSVRRSLTCTRAAC